MLHIHHAEDDRSPSKSYADACWQANPRLSPDWWREALGYTVGKLALDWRQQVFQPEHLATGCNLVLMTPETCDAARRTVAAQTPPGAVAEILVTGQPLTFAAPLPPILLWAPQGATQAERLETLIQLERMVKSGQIEAYGLSFGSLPTPPLHVWLEDAAIAAETAYGRRKRPALRVLHAPLDLTDLSLLTSPATLHKTEPVTTLELASRLGLVVIASPVLQPAQTQPAPEALAALTAMAEQEHALNQALNGWPQAHGQPLFSVLAHLAAGHTPWGSVSQWYNWQNHLLPELLEQWRNIHHPAVPAYLNALKNIQAYGAGLAASAEANRRTQLLEDFRPRLPGSHQHLDAQQQNLAILAAIPGVTAVASAVPLAPEKLRNLPDIADIGAVLLA